MKRKLTFMAVLAALTLGPSPWAFAGKARYETVDVHGLIQTSLGASHVQEGVTVTFVVASMLGSMTVTAVTDKNGQCRFDLPILGRAFAQGRKVTITMSAAWSGWESQTVVVTVPPHLTDISGPHPPPPQAFDFNFSADLVLTYRG